MATVLDYSAKPIPARLIRDAGHLGAIRRAANETKLELPATAAGADTSIATSKNWQVTIG